MWYRHKKSATDPAPKSHTCYARTNGTSIHHDNLHPKLITTTSPSPPISGMAAQNGLSNGSAWNPKSTGETMGSGKETAYTSTWLGPLLSHMDTHPILQWKSIRNKASYKGHIGGKRWDFGGWHCSSDLSSTRIVCASPPNGGGGSGGNESRLSGIV